MRVPDFASLIRATKIPPVEIRRQARNQQHQRERRHGPERRREEIARDECVRRQRRTSACANIQLNGITSTRPEEQRVAHRQQRRARRARASASSISAREREEAGQRQRARHADPFLVQRDARGQEQARVGENEERDARRAPVRLAQNAMKSVARMSASEIRATVDPAFATLRRSTHGLRIRVSSSRPT